MFLCHHRLYGISKLKQLFIVLRRPQKGISHHARNKRITRSKIKETALILTHDFTSVRLYSSIAAIYWVEFLSTFDSIKYEDANLELIDVING